MDLARVLIFCFAGFLAFAAFCWWLAYSARKKARRHYRDSR